MASLLPSLARRAFFRGAATTSRISSRPMLLPTSSTARIPLPSPQIRHSSTASELQKPPPASPLPTPTASTQVSPPTAITPSITEATDLETLKTYHTALLHQPPWYTTIHVHSFPYLVTLGDRIMLPSLLYGPPSPSNPLNKPLQPGDVIRLTHASTLGSREYTVKGTPYIDERMFTCRAVVVEVTSEPMREKKKKKRRNRKTKIVKSKHKYTVLRICELKVNDFPEFEATAPGEVAIGADTLTESI